MSSNQDIALELELKQLIIDALDLEDITPADIDTNDALFVDGLGLDSIDALELGVSLQKTYGIKLDPEDENTREHFANITNLAKLVSAQRSN